MGACVPMTKDDWTLPWDFQPQDLPQCCNYPGINREYTHPPGLMVTCDKELRCMKRFVKGAEICALPHFHGCLSMLKACVGAECADGMSCHDTTSVDPRSGPGSVAANITAQKQARTTLVD